MAYRDIPDGAVAAYAIFTSYLARALRDNDQWLANACEAILEQLDPATGHKHTESEQESFDYNYQDRIRTRSGINDKLNIRFGGGAGAYQDVEATLSAGNRRPANHATHVENQLRAAIFAAIPAYGSSGAVPLTVTYETEEESPTRGFFIIRNTGSTDNPEPRVLWLLFGSGGGVDRSAAPSMGFVKKDRRGAYGYEGDSGFWDSFLQDRIKLWNGGKLGTEAFLNLAFTTPKFSARIVPGAAFQADSIAGTGTGGSGQIASGAIRGRCFGAANTAFSGVLASLGAGGTALLSIDIPDSTGTHARKPCITPCCESGATQGDLTIYAIGAIPGAPAGYSRWAVSLKNNGAGTLTNIYIAGY